MAEELNIEQPEVDDNQQEQQPPAPAKPPVLKPEQEKELHGIISNMILNKESEDNIKLVINRYTEKYGSLAPATPAQTPEHHIVENQGPKFDFNYLNDLQNKPVSESTGIKKPNVSIPKSFVSTADLMNQKVSKANDLLKNEVIKNGSSVIDALTKKQREQEYYNSLQQNTQKSDATRVAPLPPPIVLPDQVKADRQDFIEAAKTNPALNRKIVEGIANTPQKKAALYAIDAQGRPENAHLINKNISDIENGDVVYNSQNKKLEKNLPFFQSLIGAIKNHSASMDDYDDYTKMSDDKIIAKEMARHDKFNPDIPAETPTGIGEMIGSNIVPLAKSIGADVGIAAAGTLAPEAAAPAIAAASPWLSALYTSSDFYKTAYAGTLSSKFHELVNNGVDPNTALQKAKEDASFNAKIAYIQGVAMTGVGLKMGNKIGGKYTPTESVKNIIKDVAGQSLLAGTAKAVENIHEGKDVLKDVDDAMGSTGLFMLALGAIHKLPELTAKAGRKILNSVASQPQEVIDATLSKGVETGVFKPEQAQDIHNKISEVKQSTAGLPNDVPEENRDKIAALIQKRKELENRLDKEHPSYVDPAFHAQIKEEINGVKKETADGKTEGKDGINEQIRKLSAPTKSTESEEPIQTFKNTPKTETNEKAKTNAEAQAENVGNKEDAEQKPASSIKPEYPNIETTDQYRTANVGNHEGELEFKNKKSDGTLDKSKESQTPAKDQQVENISKWDVPLDNGTENPKGETMKDFVGRVIGKYIEDKSNGPDNTTIIAHSSVLKAIKTYEKLHNTPEFKDADWQNLTPEQHKIFTDKYIEESTTNGDIETYDSPAGKIHVARHGQTEDNLTGKFRTNDTQLTDKGIDQAKQVGQKLKEASKGESIPKIISSDLPRAVHTSNVAMEQMEGKPRVRVSSANITNVKLKENAVQKSSTTEMGVGNETTVRPEMVGHDQSGEPTKESTGQSGTTIPPTEIKEGKTSSEEGNQTSIMNDPLSKWREEQGLLPIEKEMSIGDKEIFNEVKSKVAENSNYARGVVEDILNGNLKLKDARTAQMALIYDLAQSQKEYYQASDNLAKSRIENRNETQDYLDLGAALENINRNNKAAELSGFQLGGALRLRQFILNDDYSAGQVQKRVNNAYYGTEVPKEIQAQVDELVKKNQELQAKLDALSQKAAKDKAEKEITKAKTTRTQKIKSHEEYEKEREDILKNIKDKWNESKGQLSSTILPYADRLAKIAPDVAKLMKSYVAEGIDKLEDIVKAIHEKASGFIPEITQKDIHNIIAGEYNKIPETKSELTKKVDDLRMQAKLINRLEKLQSGEEPKAASEKVKRSNEIEQLKQKIKDYKEGQKENSDKVSKSNLDILKDRNKKEIARIKDKIAKGDYTKDEPKIPTKLDQEAIDLRNELNKVRGNLDKLIAQKEFENRPTKEKVLDYVNQGMKATAVFGLDLYAKLAGAAWWRMVLGIPQRYVASPIVRAGFRAAKALGSEKAGKVLSEARREHHFSTGAISDQVNAIINKNIIKELSDMLRKGETDFTTKNFIKDAPPKQKMMFIDQVYNSHGMVKYIPKKAEFVASLKIGLEKAAANGENINDPVIFNRELVSATDDANRAVFMNDNPLTKNYNRVLNSLDKAKTSDQIKRLVANYYFPVTRIPINIAAESFNYKYGGFTALYKLLSNKVESLDQKQSDFIIKAMSQQLVGLGAYAIGYFNHHYFGGLRNYATLHPQQHEDDKKEKMPFGSINIGGNDLDELYFHHPLFWQMQSGATTRYLIEQRHEALQKSVDKENKKIMAEHDEGNYSRKLMPNIPETFDAMAWLEASTVNMENLAHQIPFIGKPYDVTTNPLRHPKTWLQETIASPVDRLIPTAAKNIAVHLDPKDEHGKPVWRVPENVVQQIEMSIPGLRQNVPIRVPKPAKKKPTPDDN